jgi:hypothetical protein
MDSALCNAKGSCDLIQPMPSPDKVFLRMGLDIFHLWFAIVNSIKVYLNTISGGYQYIYPIFRMR